MSLDLLVSDKKDWWLIYIKTNLHSGILKDRADSLFWYDHFGISIRAGRKSFAQVFDFLANGSFACKLQHNMTTFIALMKEQKAFGISVCRAIFRLRRESPDTYESKCIEWFTIRVWAKCVMVLTFKLRAFGIYR